jgi:hypothetical protein
MWVPFDTGASTRLSARSTPNWTGRPGAIASITPAAIAIRQKGAVLWGGISAGEGQASPEAVRTVHRARRATSTRALNKGDAVRLTAAGPAS